MKTRIVSGRVLTLCPKCNHWNRINGFRSRLGRGSAVLEYEAGSYRLTMRNRCRICEGEITTVLIADGVHTEDEA